MALNKPTGEMLNAGSNTTAQDLGTAAAGTSSSYSRADHVHKLPSAADVGAIATTQLGLTVATLDAGGKLTTAQIPALTTSQISQITPVVIGAISTDQASGFATLSSGTLRTDQMAALTGDVTSAAGNPATTVVKIQSKAISNATPGAGQVLTWDGSQWAPATSSGGGGGGANGLTYYFNQATAADAPVTNIPGTVHQLGRSGEAGQTTVTTGSLTQNVWTRIAGFVSETAPQDPAVISIPAGLWDTNVWCFGDANVNAGTSIRAVAYIYSLAGGGTLTALGSPSSAQVINGTSAQYSLSVLVPQTTILATDRIYIALEAFATGNNHTVTAQFGDSTPSHIHTSLPLVGGTGLWKSVAGAVQSPATLLFNADVDPAAAIAVSKISGLAASATTDTTNASNITSGTLNTAQLAIISGLPTGAQGSASVTPVVTVDNKGRVTALSTATITPAAIGAIATSQLSSLATLTGGTLTTTQMLALTGDVTSAAGSPATTLATITTAQTAVGNANTVPVVSIDAKGRVTALTTATISGGSGTGTVTTTGSTLTGSLSKFSTETAITKAVAGTDYQAALTTSQPLALSLGGTGAINAFDALTNLGASARYLEAVVTANTPGTMNTGVTPHTFTVTTTGPLVADTTFTGVSGDVLLLTGQTTTIQRGPWEIVTQGTTSPATSTVLRRPSWFSGVAKPFIGLVRYGSAYYGFAFLTYGGATDIIVGTTVPTSVSFSSRATNATLGTNLFTTYQTFRANGLGSNSCPFFFQTGAALMTSPQAHGVEWFSDQMYITSASSTRKRVSYIEESVTSTAFATALNVDIDAQEIVLLTSAATANFTVNVRGSSTVAYNSIIEVGKSRSFVLLNTNTTTGWSISSISVDGTAQTVKWVNSVSVGNVNSLDAWTITIIKTAASTYTVLASVAKYV
jgi:hypothetical protein